MAEIGVFVSTAEVFPGQPSDAAALIRSLRQLSRTDVLFTCCRVNHLLTNNSSRTAWERQAGTIRNCFDNVSRERIDRALRGCAENAGTVFFRAQLLELLRWAALVCEDHPDDGTTFELPANRQAFGQAALIASDIWARRVYGDLHRHTKDIESLRDRAIGPFRKGIEGSMTAPSFEVLGRGWRVFTQLIPAIDPKFQQHFESITGITVEQHYVCCGALMAQYMQVDSDPTIFDAEKQGESTKAHALVRRFLALECQTPDQMRVALWGDVNRDRIPPSYLDTYDYRPLREKPILRAADGRATIIDPVFMFEKASVGPLFEVVRGRPQEANHWFEVFGKAFEQYAQAVLRQTIPKPSPALVDPLALSIEGKDSKGVWSEPQN